MRSLFLVVMLFTVTSARAQTQLGRLSEVDPSNSSKWPGSDAGAWINAAMAALANTGGELYVAAGAYTFSTTIVIKKNVQFRGAGRNSTLLKYTGSGDAIEMEAGTSPPYMNGAILGITLEGNANPNAVGIHHIDTIGSLYDDVTIENFNGTNGTGIWFENRHRFSERLNLRQLSMYRNSVGWRFTNSNADQERSNSFSYWWVSGVHFQIASNQTGILASAAGLMRGTIPSIFLLNGDFGISANEEDKTSTLIRLINGAAFSGDHFDIFAECTGCQANGTGFSIDAKSTVSGDGHISLDAMRNDIRGTYSLRPQSSEITGSGALVFSHKPALFNGTLNETDLYQNTSVKPKGTATNSENFDSHPLIFEGSYWNGSAALADRWILTNVIGAGKSSSATLTLDHKGTDGTASVQVPALSIRNLSGTGIRCVQADEIGNVHASSSGCVLSASLTTTAASSDVVSIRGMTSQGHCSISATSANAAQNLAGTYIEAKARDQITVAHPAQRGLRYDILCTRD